MADPAPATPPSGLPPEIANMPATLGPPPDAPIAQQEEEDHPPELPDYYLDLVEDIEEHQKSLDGDAFVRKLRKGVEEGIRFELQNETYDLLRKLAKLGAEHAEFFEDYRHRTKLLEVEIERQGNLLRAFLSGSVMTLAVRLSELTMERSADQEMKTVAGEILALMRQAQDAATQAIQRVMGAATPTETTSEPSGPAAEPPKPGVSGA